MGQEAAAGERLVRPQSWERVSPRKPRAGGRGWRCPDCCGHSRGSQCPMVSVGSCQFPQAWRLVPSGAMREGLRQASPLLGGWQSRAHPHCLSSIMWWSPCVCVSRPPSCQGPPEGPRCPFTPGTSLSPAHLHRPCLESGTFTGQDPSHSQQTQSTAETLQGRPF